MKRSIGFIVLIFLSLACNSLTGSPQPTPTANPITTATLAISIFDTDVYCSSESDEARSLYNKALTLETAGDFEGALELYARAIELDPEYCDAMDNLALNLKRLKRVEESIPWYQRSLEILPTNDAALLGLANAYSYLSRFDEARAEFQKLIDLYPQNPEGYYGMGNVEYSSGNFQNAVDWLKQSETLYIEQGSNYAADAQLLIGYSYFDLSDMPNTILYLEKAYPTHKDDRYLNYFLGISYYVQSPSQDLDKAKQLLTEAKRLGYPLEPEFQEFIKP
jgi:tetratricopeptide (TPR) repeat protein